MSEKNKSKNQVNSQSESAANSVRRYAVYRHGEIVLETDRANEAMLEFLRSPDEDGTSRLFDRKIQENIAWNECA